MSRVYVLISQLVSPAFITTPKVVAVYQSAKEAKAEARRRNGSNLTRHEYWVESVPYITPHRPVGDTL